MTEKTVPAEQPVPPQTADSPPPRSPTDLPARDWKESVRRTAEEFKNDRGPLVAAGMAFYWFLAIFPAILAAVGILGLVGLGADTVAEIVKGLQATLPGDSDLVLSEAVEKASTQSRSSSVVATVVGLGVALWSASAGMVAVQVGCDVAYDITEDRKFLAKRAVALLLVLVTAVLAGIASALIVFGQPLGEAVRDHLPFGDAFVVVWTLLRWTLGLGALVVLFACMYSIAPNRETPRWTWVSPGGILAMAGWLVASLAFSFYVSSAGSYVETYGSITGVVMLLLWLYLSALAVVAGAELNAQLERQGEIRRRTERRRAKGRRTAERPPPPPPAAEGDGDSDRDGEGGSGSYWDAWAAYGRHARDESGR